MKPLQHATLGEAKVARRLIRKILSEGFCISIFDGEEITVRKSTHFPTILSALATTGQDNLDIFTPQGLFRGTFTLVWGNDPSGEELIADHTANHICEKIAAHANKEFSENV